jgi:hypothetical protein
MDPNGAILFSDQFVKTFEADLMSGFVSAIYHYMSKTIFTGELDTLEVGGLRFIFDIQEVGEEEHTVIFVALVDRTDNIAEFKPKLEQIKWKFIERYYQQILTWNAGDQNYFCDFQETERGIFEQKGLNLDLKTERSLLTEIQGLYSHSPEILGVALLNVTGKVIYSFIEDPLLQIILRTVEGRFHAGFLNIRKLISEEKDGILVILGNEQVLCTVLVKSSCKIDQALKIAEDFSDKVHLILNSNKIGITN